MAQITLKSLRIAKGMTQREAAAALGVGAPTLGRWEANTTMPDVLQAAKLAKLYDISFDEMFSIFMPKMDA